jgi:hypothetical protein
VKGRPVVARHGDHVLVRVREPVPGSGLLTDNDAAR